MRLKGATSLTGLRLETWLRLLLIAIALGVSLHVARLPAFKVVPAPEPHAGT